MGHNLKSRYYAGIKHTFRSSRMTQNRARCEIKVPFKIKFRALHAYEILQYSAIPIGINFTSRSEHRIHAGGTPGVIGQVHHSQSDRGKHRA